jgi:hypothetical protein
MCKLGLEMITKRDELTIAVLIAWMSEIAAYLVSISFLEKGWSSKA